MKPVGQTSRLSGLYIILDPAVCPDRPLTEILTASAEAGARIFQYRNKTASMKEAYIEGSALRARTRELGVLFIVNDRCDLAMALEADGVHLGQEDLPLNLARQIMGPDRLIGISTHNPDQVLAADAGMADYLGFGPIFTPGSKADHDPLVGIEGLRTIRPLTTLPIFAIGGIQPDRAGQVTQAGADGVAVVSAVMKAKDIKETVREFFGRMPTPNSPTS